MKTSPNDVSNEELARMIQEGFLEIGRKFDEVNGQFAQNRKEHAEMMWKLSETVHRSEHNNLKLRVDRLEEAKT